ncbi:hypothetical protein [Shinella sp. M31]|uniref:hypothetical protein n=1 Tax=Shinella sp. M31 TaxID=3368615 RepID=UPI003B9E72CF
MSDDPLLARLQRLAEDLPGVETGTSYGTPALKVAGKLFVRIKDGETLVLMVPLDDKERLIERTPDLRYETDHYKGLPGFWCAPPSSTTRSSGTASPNPGASRRRPSCANCSIDLSRCPLDRAQG